MFHDPELSQLYKEETSRTGNGTGWEFFEMQHQYEGCWDWW